MFGAGTAIGAYVGRCDRKLPNDLSSAEPLIIRAEMALRFACFCFLIGVPSAARSRL
jgi:hypothetical protein